MGVTLGVNASPCRALPASCQVGKPRDPHVGTQALWCWDTAASQGLRPDLPWASCPLHVSRPLCPCARTPLVQECLAGQMGRCLCREQPGGAGGRMRLQPAGHCSQAPASGASCTELH